MTDENTQMPAEEIAILPQGKNGNEAPVMTQEEALAQLPDELKASMGKIMKYHGKWIVRLPDVMRKVDGKDVHSERFLSNNGDAMRVFHTKAQAEAGLQYYQSLVVARIALREDQEKQNTEVPAEVAQDHENAKPEVALW